MQGQTQPGKGTLPPVSKARRGKGRLWTAIDRICVYRAALSFGAEGRGECSLLLRRRAGHAFIAWTDSALTSDTIKRLQQLKLFIKLQWNGCSRFLVFVYFLSTKQCNFTSRFKPKAS